MDSGALAGFGQLQKKIYIGEGLTTTPVWVDRPKLKEEGQWKSDGNRSGYQIGGGVGGGDTVQNIVLDIQLQSMEKFGELMTVASLENLL